MIIVTSKGEENISINSVKELIKAFDTPEEKPLYTNRVSNYIHIWGTENPERTSEDEFIYEKLAYSLKENHNVEAWNTRFGPNTYIPLPNGLIIRPEYNEITDKAIDYWEQRIYEVNHPIIKLQYFGLVHTFKERITGQKCSETLLREYFQTIIDASSNGYELPIMSIQHHLPIAFDIAKQYKELLPKIKDEYLRVTSNALDSHIGIWLAYFTLMLENINDKSLFNFTEKNALVDSVEKRLGNLIALDPNASGEQKLNPFIIKDVVEVLAKYYKQTNEKANKERVVSYVDNAFRRYLVNGNHLQQLLWLETIQKFYFQFGMQEKSQNLYPEIQCAAIQAKSSLTQVEETISIPKEIIESLISTIDNGTEDEVYKHFVSEMTPKHAAITKIVEQQSIHPLANIMGTQILSETGLPLSYLGTPSTDKEGNEYHVCADYIIEQNPVLQMVIKHLSYKKYFTQEKIVEHIMNSGLIDNSRKHIIELGIGYYMKKDYITACHLLIPQIEHAICTLALKTDAQAIRMQPSGKGYMVQLMDKLFDEEAIKQTLGDDSVFYLRTLLTEQRGLNLRNLLCHGLINPMYFDINQANRIIHALLLLGGLTY